MRYCARQRTRRFVVAEQAATPGQVVKPQALSVPKGKAKIMKQGQTYTTNAWGSDYNEKGVVGDARENPPL
jgi:hypothetical protein